MSDKYPPEMLYTSWHGGGDMVPTILTPEEALRDDAAVVYFKAGVSGLLWYRRANAAQDTISALRARVAELEAELEEIQQRGGPI